MQNAGPGWRAVLGTKLVYDGTDRAGGAEPWATDGVAAPVRLKDINTDTEGQPFDHQAVLGNKMYFMAVDTAHGYEMWSTDGTPAGTNLVADVHPGEASSGFYALTPYNGRVYFINYASDVPGALWSTDGTSAGTRQDVSFESLGLQAPYELCVCNGALFFLATGRTTVDGRYRFQLWKTDGTPSGSAKISDIETYSVQSLEHEFTVADGLLYFTITGSTEAAAWRTDGTPGGTVKLVESPYTYYAFNFTEAGGKVFFHAGGNDGARELWVTDGTIQGTQIVAPDVINPAVGSQPQYPTEYRGRLFFVGYDGSKMALFETDGTVEGTRHADVPGFTNLGGLFRYNDRLYFVGRNSQNRETLMKTDGTPAGTEAVFAPATGGIQGSPFMFEINDVLAFQASAGNTTHWYLTDGTTAGTSEVTGTYTAWWDPMQVGTRMLFPADSPGKGFEWWRVGVTDTVRPQASWAKLTRLPSGGNAVGVVFTENVAASLTTSDLVLTDMATGSVIASPFSAVSFDAATNTATFTVSTTRFPGGKLPVGRYRVSIAAGAVADAAGNTSAAPFQSEFGVPAPATVASRYVFYNGSSLDGGSAAADPRDDAAIATDKQALRAAAAATFSNVTSYTRGINGIIVDLVGLPSGVILGGNDFSFRASGAGGSVPVPPPSSITIRRGAGAGGSDRVTIVWPADGVRNGWLEVTVKANDHTGLSAPDVFTLGNLVGDTGGTGFVIDASDVLRTRSNLGHADAASLQRYDFNRDGVINFQDLFSVRHAQSRAAALPAAPAAAPAAAPVERATRAGRPPRRSLFGDESALLAGLD